MALQRSYYIYALKRTMRFFLHFAYDGTDFHGWQFQPNALSVQEVFENALSKLLGTKTALTAAGRTDAGVHARCMYAHFDVEKPSINHTTLSTNEFCDQLCYRLNAFLPDSIAVFDCQEVSPDAHARFDATARSYRYEISLIKDPFKINKAYYLKQALSVDAMQKAADILLEYDDFECFSRTHTDVKSFLCNITQAQWTEVDQNLYFDITANRFLRNMVRAIVGTLLEVGTHKISPEAMHRIIAGKKRSKAGASVPAHGLYLQSITYPKSIFIHG